jgi:hypothetical protein
VRRIPTIYAVLAAITLIAALAGCAVRGQASPLPRTDLTTEEATPSAEAPTIPTAGQRPQTGFVPASASFPTPDTGYAWGVYPCPDDPNAFCSGLAVTQDGGATWKLRTAPAGTPIDPYRPATLRFVDPNDGWALLGDQLQVTHNGAASWQRIGLSGLPKPTIVALEAGPAGVFAVAGSDSESLRLYRSSATDSTFTLIDDVTLPQAGTAVHFSFASDGSGYLVADSLAGASSLLYATKDGSTWLPRASPCPSESRTAIAAGIAGAVNVICDLHPTPTTADKQTWISNTAGATFTAVKGPAASGFTTAMAVVPAFPASPPAVAASTLPSLTYVVAASTTEDRIYLTVNGGRSWTVAYANSSDGSGAALGLRDLQFSDADHGIVVLGNAGAFAKDRLAGSFAVLSPRLLLTSDGGKHWAQSVIH